MEWLLEKKSFIGGFTALSSRSGDEKGSATHVRLTVEEYDDIMETIRFYKLQLERERSAHASDVKKTKDEARSDIARAAEEARASVNQANARVAAAEAERDRQADLNSNLLRISRERANAKRGLQPKKEHHGYRFSGKIMQTKSLARHDKKSGPVYADVWTAVLETPYDGTIPIDQIRDRIFNDLKGTAYDPGILKKLGVKYWTLKGSTEIWKGSYAAAMEDNADSENYLFDYKFMINPKSGLWEVQIITLKSIKALPEMMGNRLDRKAMKETEYVDDTSLFETEYVDDSALFETQV